MKIVTFLSDFGEEDWFVAAVKGEILKIDPDIKVIDITHKVKHHDIKSAAFILKNVYKNFPDNTVHLVVVDPGVGSKRKPIIIGSEKYYFIGPDNGVFSYIDAQKMKFYEIDVKARTSTTFHGRDIFGPVAALLAAGRSPSDFGKEIHNIHRFEFPEVSKEQDHISGQVVYIDHFGNLITNISNDNKIVSIEIIGRKLAVKEFYGQAKREEIVCLKGSSGYYEIASYKKSARELLGVSIGEIVRANFLQ